MATEYAVRGHMLPEAKPQSMSELELLKEVEIHCASRAQIAKKACCKVPEPLRRILNP